MRPSGRRGRRWNSILLSATTQFNLGSSPFLSRENSTKQTRLGAKRQSCSRPLLPVIDGRCSLLSSAATARRPCAKRNWSPTTGFRRFELALAHYVRGDRKAADAALADLIANGRDQLAYQIAEVYAVRGEKDKAFEWLQISFDNHDAGMLESFS